MYPQKKSRLAPIVVIVLLLGALLVVKQCHKKGGGKTTDAPKTQTKEVAKPKQAAEYKGLDRNPSAINYSKHARCRMDCRHISELEVREILKDGKINYSKSDIGDNPDCKKKYAVEGNTHDNQRVRIIFAPCQSEVTVVTVIDLGKEWACECEGGQ